MSEGGTTAHPPNMNMKAQAAAVGRLRP